MVVSTDLVASRNGEGDHGLEVYPNRQTNINTGVYFVRSNEGGWLLGSSGRSSRGCS